MPRMLSIREAVIETGLTYNALRQLCMSGQIVHIRVGTKYLINMDRLEDFLNGEMQDETRMDKNS